MLTPRKALALLGCCLALPLGAMQTDNYALRAVPAPGDVKLDGDLKDWDLSGSTLSCYDLETMLDNHSVRAAAMYDAKRLYLSFRFKDPTPMVNHNNPDAYPDKGWTGDCVQLRFWIDPDKPYGPPSGGRVLHLDAYWAGDFNKPAAKIAYNNMADRAHGAEGSLDQAVGNGVEMAFQEDADGKGYTQELAIDWKLLRRDGSAFKAGDSLRLGMEFMWGSPVSPLPEHRYADLINEQKPMREFFWTSNDSWGEVKFMPRGNVEPSSSLVQEQGVAKALERKYATTGVVPLRYTLPEAQNVTLVIEKPDGTRVRNLISDYPRPAGENVDWWDGLDDNGKPVPPGDYRYRGLRHGKLDVLFQFAYGSCGNPPWATTNRQGGWLGDHTYPVGAASDGDWVYLSHLMSESADCIIALDATGQKRWGLGRIVAGLLAVQGDYLYTLCGGELREEVHCFGGKDRGEISLLKIDKRNGKVANFSDGKSLHLVAEFQRPALPPLPFEGKMVERHLFDADSCRMAATGFAAAPGRLYVSMRYDNKVLVLDLASGKVTGEIPLDHPEGLATAKDGTLYAISGTKVMKLGADGKFTPFVTSGLTAPLGLAVGPGGDVYVSDWGDQMDVKVFSPDGELVRTVGKAGGRPLEGAYEVDGMFRPWGLAVDGKSRLWVSERDQRPKRISVWNQQGEFEREFCGPAWYGSTECNVDTLNPKQAFCMGSVVDLDWDKGLWRVASTLWRPTKANALFGPIGEHGVIETLEIDGRKLLVFTRSRSYFCVSALEGGKARPLMARGSLKDFMGFAQVLGMAEQVWPDSAALALAKTKYPALFDGNSSQDAKNNALNQAFGAVSQGGKPFRSQFLWTDADGDGLVQLGEMRFFAPEAAGGLEFQGYWRCAFDANLTQYLPKAKGVVYRWPVKEWNSAGAPVYDLADAKVFANNVSGDGTWASPAGEYVAHGDPLMRFDKDGKLKWTYPNKWSGVHGSHAAPQDMNGRLIGTLKVIGSADLGGELGELFCLSGNMGKAFFFTADGLYVGSLLRDGRSAPDAMPDKASRGMSIMSTSAGGEWFGGEFFRNKLDGKLYLGSNSGTCAQMLSEVAGLDGVKRLPFQDFQFTATQAEQAKERLAVARIADKADKWLDVHPAKGGKPSWDGKDMASWSFDDKRSARAAWSVDQDSLHVRFDVKGSTAMVNGGQLATRLFKTGDAALLELRVLPDDQRKDVQPGDFRLLLSVFQGKPVAVLYRYKALPGEKTQPEDFAIGVGSTHADVVKILAGAKLAIDRKPDGYSYRASIPLSELGFKPQAGKSYRGDFGIVYGAASGNVNELRMNWANHDTGLVADLPGEARVNPDKWGTFVVKDN